MVDHTLPKTVAEIDAELAAALDLLATRVGALDPADAARPGADGWSVNDHVAHLTAWLAGMDALLRKANRVAAMGLTMDDYLSGDFDRMNAVIQAAHAGESWAVVWQGYQDAVASMRRTLATLSDADLQRTYAYFQPDEPGRDSGAPIAAWIEGNSYGHIHEHLPWIEALIATQDD